MIYARDYGGGDVMLTATDEAGVRTSVRLTPFEARVLAGELSQAADSAQEDERR